MVRRWLLWMLGCVVLAEYLGSKYGYRIIDYPPASCGPHYPAFRPR
jgi:hypothetical protein